MEKTEIKKLFQLTPTRLLTNIFTAELRAVTKTQHKPHLNRVSARLIPKSLPSEDVSQFQRIVNTFT